MGDLSPISPKMSTGSGNSGTGSDFDLSPLHNYGVINGYNTVPYFYEKPPPITIAASRLIKQNMTCSNISGKVQGQGHNLTLNDFG